MVTVQVTQVTPNCCEGFIGDDCEIQHVSTKEQSCGGMTCPDHPDASCVIVRHCGKSLELFLDQNGLIIKDCVPENICLGACVKDPCKDLSCSEYPEALCFTSCNCEPLWVIPSNRKRVQCSHSDSLKKRDTTDSCM